MTDSAETRIPSAAACADAAAWIARLHGEARTAKVEAGFQRWLAASAEHRAAFDMANDIWVGVERLPKTPALPAAPQSRMWAPAPARAFAACAGLLLLFLGGWFYWRDPGLTTRAGEQRTLTLEDGTRVYLNTASRMHVHYDRASRRVELDNGEAYFEVAKHADWPFVVIAGGRQVVARGTAFLVRRDAERIAVTLVEGKVTVAPAGEPVASAAAATGGSTSQAALPEGAKDQLTLSPGQRVTFAGRAAPTLDQPPLERVTAWQRGQVVLDHTPLADAVAEMNRYSDIKLQIEDPAARRAEVTGIFRTGDSEYFAQAVSETYHLRVASRGREIILSGSPRAAGPNVTNEK
jgi:transmembrane sensor